MGYRQLTILIMSFTLFTSLVVRGQITARVEGLEQNPKYMSLLLQEKQLHNTEDSIVKRIDDNRKKFSTQPEQREKISQEILKLENELFDVRNRIGVVVNSISAIEQQFVIDNLGGGSSITPSRPTVTPTVATVQVKNLVYNDYFKKNLSQADYASLLTAQQDELLPPRMLESYVANYNQMNSLLGTYDHAERAEAESALQQFNVLKGINKHLEDSINQVWGSIFDNKMYLYNYLLEKLNKSELLSDFETQYRETNQLIASAREQVESEVAYGYPLRKKLILSYETSLATQLGYTEAKDSLSKAIRVATALSYNLPKLEVTFRNFIPYADIKTTTPSIYNSKNPIPVMEVFKHGTVYRIQIGVFSTPQPISTFRYASPLCYEKLDDGRYRYCAGAYRTMAEAEAGLAQMKKIGFRVPEIVVWRDGEFESMSQSRSSRDAGSTIYRVEIEEGGENLPEEVKSILDNSAANKEVSRTSRDGKFIYTIGSFDTREAAQSIVDQIAATGKSSAKVLVIEN